MGAFMFVTAFLSMWISNTATTAMMLPIAVATVKTITGEDGDEESSQNSDPEADQLPYDTKVILLTFLKIYGAAYVMGHNNGLLRFRCWFIMKNNYNFRFPRITSFAQN